MSVESDALAEAALRFSEAIRAERTSTFDALASERQAALKIIEALRAERVRGNYQATGRFAIGVALGVAAGIAAIYYASQRATEEARLGLTASPAAEEQEPADAFAGLRERFRKAVEDGKHAMQHEESELWQRYRQRIVEAQQPPPPKPDEFLY